MPFKKNPARFCPMAAKGWLRPRRVCPGGGRLTSLVGELRWSSVSLYSPSDMNGWRGTQQPWEFSSQFAVSNS